MTKHPLHHMPAGRKGKLLGIQSNEANIIRLIEMGMTIGAEVTLLRRAPFGCPIQIAICGTELCLRKEQASQFWVQALET